MTGSYPVHVRPLQTVASLLVCGLVYIVILGLLWLQALDLKYDTTPFSFLVSWHLPFSDCHEYPPVLQARA